MRPRWRRATACLALCALTPFTFAGAPGARVRIDTEGGRANREARAGSEVWSFSAGGDTVTLEEIDGRHTVIEVNGAHAASIPGAITGPEFPRELTKALDGRLRDAAGFAGAMRELALERAPDASCPQPPDEQASPSVAFGGLLCTPVCWHCYGYELRGVTAVAGTIAACTATPATGITAAACAAGGLLLVHLAFTAGPACRDCFLCWGCMSGVPEACGGWPDPGGGCPPGSHPGPTTECGGSSPCCCDDDPPHACGAP